ncbi:MAG: hypothetical protein Q9172_006710 [Xanthocarpia lactea]
MDAKERKRAQNRIAQRTYRRNQKERLRSLELAAGHGAGRGLPQQTPTPPVSGIDHGWLSRLNDYFESSAEFQAPDIPNVPVSSSTEDKPKSQSATSGNEGDAQGPFNNLLTETQPILHRTALHRAVCARHGAITRLLLQQGADATKQDGNGQTCLHLAVQNGWEDSVKLLLESKVDPSMKDALGQTALYQAVQCENIPMARLLLESSIDVNSRDAFGEVALHLAVDRGSEAMIGVLLSYGADINA